jgi:hypothetical protein
MSYEILLSDTARAELERDHGQAVESLLTRVAQSAALDHVLSAEQSRFELRYQSLGTTYLFFRRDENARTVKIVYFCEMHPPPAVLPSVQEPKLRVIEQQIRDIPHGMEAELTIERTKEDGSTTTHQHFVRKIDLGDSYVTIVHQPPGGTMILTGKKGALSGDFRHDELELVHLMPDGTVKRFPASTVPVLIKNPFEGDGRPLDERMRDYMQSPLFQQRMQHARKWFRLG